MPTCILGDGGAPPGAAACSAGQKCRDGQLEDRELFLCEKKAKQGRVTVRPIYGAGAYNQYTETQTQLVFASVSLLNVTA